MKKERGNRRRKYIETYTSIIHFDYLPLHQTAHQAGPDAALTRSLIRGPAATTTIKMVWLRDFVVSVNSMHVFLGKEASEHEGRG